MKNRRLAYLSRHYGPAVCGAAMMDSSSSYKERLRDSEPCGASQRAIAAGIIRDLMTYDPCTNNRCSTWIVREYAKRNFRCEDGQRIAEALKWFAHVSSALKRTGKSADILTYTLPELLDLKRELSSGVSISQDLSFGDMSDISIYYQGEDGVIFIPLTAAASVRVASNTEWCTAHPDPAHNRFEQYTAGGTPLYIWRSPTMSFYQFWVSADGEVQIADRNDQMLQRVVLDELRRDYRCVNDLCEKLLRASLSVTNPYGQNARWVRRDQELAISLLWQPGSSADVELCEKIYSSPALSLHFFGRYEGLDKKRLLSSIDSSPETAVARATRFDCNRLQLLEPMIIDHAHPETAAEYSARFFDGHWLDYEAHLLENGRSLDALNYLRALRYKRSFKSGDHCPIVDQAHRLLSAIVRQPANARALAQILGGPLAYEAEASILTDFETATLYYFEFYAPHNKAWEIFYEAIRSEWGQITELADFSSAIESIDRSLVEPAILHCEGEDTLARRVWLCLSAAARIVRSDRQASGMIEIVSASRLFSRLANLGQDGDAEELAVRPA